MLGESGHTTDSGRHAVARWLLAAVVAGLVWCAVVLALGTTHPFVVTVGRSMLPTLHTGELGIIRGVPPFELHVGQIVAVHTPADDQRKYNYGPEFVHRIVGLSLQGSQLIVQTKGDHETPDPFTVPASNIDGELVAAIPGVGYALLFLHSRPGLIALGGLLLLALVYVLIGSLADVMEGSAGGGVAPGPETGDLALAIREYAVHLQSHTKVVRELGGTTEHLRAAAATQNDILRDLREVVAALSAEAVRAPRDLREPVGPANPSNTLTGAGPETVRPAPDSNRAIVVHPARAEPVETVLADPPAGAGALVPVVVSPEVIPAGRSVRIAALVYAVGREALPWAPARATRPQDQGAARTWPLIALLPLRRQRKRLEPGRLSVIPAMPAVSSSKAPLPSRRSRKRRRPAHG